MSKYEINEIPKIIHFVVPEKILDYQRKAIDIAKKLHEDWEIRIWNDWSEVPGGRLGHYLEKANCGAQRADLLRYDIVYEYGGIYLDSDMFLRRDLDEILKISDRLVACSEDGRVLSIGFFAAPKRHPALRSVIDFLLTNEPDWSLSPVETTGPKMFSAVLRMRKDVYVLPREAFYPYLYNEPRPDEDKIHPCCFAVHEWAANWNGKGTQKRFLNAKFYAKKLKKAAKNKWRRMKKKLKLGKKGQIYGSYIDNDGDVVTAIKGKILHLSARDKSLTPYLALIGNFEREIQEFIRDNMKGGDFLIDVGANIGLHAIIAASKCGPFGRVYAVEPNKDLIKLIEKSALANFFHDRIVIVDKAASSTTDVLSFEVNDVRLGESRVCKDNSGKSIGKKIKSISLDDLIPINIPIKIIKIDVEGWEHEVIRGAKRLIENKCFDFMIIECSKEIYKNDYSKLVDSIEFILDNGYKAYRLKRGILEEVSNWQKYVPPVGQINLIFKRS